MKTEAFHLLFRAHGRVEWVKVVLLLGSKEKAIHQYYRDSSAVHDVFGIQAFISVACLPIFLD